MRTVIKVIKKNHPVYVTKVKVSELEHDRLSKKFLEHNFSEDIEVYVKCYENGEFDLRGKRGEYRLVPMSAELVN